MHPIHVVAIIVRVFATGLFLVSIKGAISLFFSAKYSLELAENIFPYAFPSLIGIFLAILLWVFPMFISKKIIPINVKNFSHRALTMNDAYHLGFVLLGSYLLFHVFSDFFYWFTLVSIESNAFNLSFTQLSIDQKATFITTIFELFIALVFIFHRKLNPKTIISSMRTHQLK